MADIRDNIIQLGEALVLAEASEYFKKLAAALKTDKGVSLTIQQSYMSAYDVVNELRLLVKDKTEKPPASIQPLLTADKEMQDIVNENNYPDLSNYLYELSPTDFEPPLPSDFVSKSGVTVKQFPNKVDVDPRRTGRLIVPGPIDVMKSTEVQKWLLNNSALYGYIPYSDNGLYYVGLDLIRANLNKASNKQDALVSFINRFSNQITASNQITINYQQILDVSVQAVSNVTTAEDLETVTNNQTKSNTGSVLDLVVIDNQPVWKDIAQAYLQMATAAKLDGVTLKISSGYRPAYGPIQSTTTSKGRTITLTTQEAIRSDKSRWINRDSFPGTDSDFIMKAPSSYYKPPTAPPGSSRHGDGIALDLNTGGRDDFQPLQTTNYTWLIKNSYKYGFIRTVGSEEWHFEYRPDQAKQGPYALLASGDSSSKFYADLGLSKGQFQV